MPKKSMRYHDRTQIQSFVRSPILSRKSKEYLQAYLMLAPLLIGFILFTIYPIGWLVRFSVYDYDGFSAEKFSGTYNFVRAFTREPGYWLALKNTFIVVFARIIVEIPLALLLAVFLNKKTKIGIFFRTAYFLPAIVSSAIVGLTFYILFDSLNGIVNVVLRNYFGVEEIIEWFGSRWKALSTIWLASVWKGFGINMVFFLMGLQSIPAELYECASIDGASDGQKFLRITLPMLAPIMQVIIMLELIESMKMADTALVLTNGQPGGQSEVIMTYIFKQFFTYGGSGLPNQLGFGASLAVITAGILAIITIVYTVVTRKMSRIY